MDLRPEVGQRGGREFDEVLARAVIAKHSGLEGAALPILHALQEEFGYVDPRCEPLVAEALGLSRAEVVGVISFYRDFRRAPAGRRLLKLCRAEACQSRGVEKVVERLKSVHGLEMDRTSADGALTLETVYCLGNCALGPAALLDGAPVGRLDFAKCDAIVAGPGGRP